MLFLRGGRCGRPPPPAARGSGSVPGGRGGSPVRRRRSPPPASASPRGRKVRAAALAPPAAADATNGPGGGGTVPAGEGENPTAASRDAAERGFSPKRPSASRGRTPPPTPPPTSSSSDSSDISDGSSIHRSGGLSTPGSTAIQTMFSKTKSPSAWNGSLNPPRCVMYATAGIANANPAATAISARRSATIKVFSRNVSLIAAKTARCVVATPTPVRALHATNNANTVDARKPNCGTTPNDKPPAPCKNNPTTISATRPFSHLGGADGVERVRREDGGESERAERDARVRRVVAVRHENAGKRRHGRGDERRGTERDAQE